MRHPMVRRKADGREYGAGDGPVSDVFAKGRAQVVKWFLLAFGHLHDVDSLRWSGSKISQPDGQKYRRQRRLCQTLAAVI